jgi:hypothetical protein
MFVLGAVACYVIERKYLQQHGSPSSSSLSSSSSTSSASSSSSLLLLHVQKIGKDVTELKAKLQQLADDMQSVRQQQLDMIERSKLMGTAPLLKASLNTPSSFSSLSSTPTKSDLKPSTSNDSSIRSTKDSSPQLSPPKEKRATSKENNNNNNNKLPNQALSPRPVNSPTSSSSPMSSSSSASEMSSPIGSRLLLQSISISANDDLSHGQNLNTETSQNVIPIQGRPSAIGSPTPALTWTRRGTLKADSKRASRDLSTQQKRLSLQKPLQGEPSGLNASGIARSPLVPTITGWLAIRAVRLYIKRWFVLRGHVLSYYKNEKMRECYGHIHLSASCQLLRHRKKGKFKIIDTSKKSLFKSSGIDEGGQSAATYTRMWHGASSNAILKAESDEEAQKWIYALNQACTNAQHDDDENILLEQVTSPADQSDGAIESEMQSDSDGETEDLSRVSTSQELYFSDNNNYQSNNNNNNNVSNNNLKNNNNGNNNININNNLENVGVTEVEKESEICSPRAEEKEEKTEMIEYNWSESEARAISSLRDMIAPLLEDEGCFNDDLLLWRFLKARSFNVEAAADMLAKNFQWRREFQPHTLTFEEVVPEVVKRRVFFLNNDKLGRPIMYLYPGNHDKNNRDSDVFIKMICYMMETVVKKMRPGVYQFSVIADLSNLGRANLDIDLLKRVAQILQSYYPERLALCVCINIPFFLKVAWQAIKPLLEERVIKKIEFMKGHEGLWDPKGNWVTIFDKSQVLEQYGGTCTTVVPTDSFGFETLH